MSVDAHPAEEAILPDSRDPMAQRILSVLEACSTAGRPRTISELVTATGLAKSTLHRICWKLEGLGMLEHETAGFTVGTKLLAIANTSPVVAQIRRAAMPHLVALQTAAGASNLAILNGRRALVVDGLYSAAFRGSPMIGMGLPLHCTAVGKAILAFIPIEDRERLLPRHMLPPATPRSISHPGMIRRHLDRVAERGVAISSEEFQPGLVGVAAAFSVHGTIAAIGTVGSSTNRAVLASQNQVVAAAAQLQSRFA